jgi:hypothetical protein
VWTAKGKRGGALYLIDASRPALIALDAAAPERIEAARVWDFSGYIHSRPPTADLGATPAPVELYPVLYPVGEHGLAVALVSHSHETYVGGGATYSYADFVTLEGKPAFSAVPFACNKMVRACFTEDEYAKSPHCHEEWTGHLGIRYGAAGIQTFVWYEEKWPAHVKGEQRSVRPFQPDPSGTEELPAPAGISFCDATVQ